MCVCVCVCVCVRVCVRVCVFFPSLGFEIDERAFALMNIHAHLELCDKFTFGYSRL